MNEKVNLQATIELVDKFSRPIRMVGDEVNRLANRFTKLGGGPLRNLQSGLSGISTKLNILTGAVIAAGTGLVKFAVESADKFEKANLKYETLLGSASKATKRVAELTEFAARTPFQLEDITRADIILEGFGIRSVDMLTRIGNAAAISESSMGDLALIFGQLSQSKDLENIRQLVDRGVISFTELRNAGIKFGKDGSVQNSVDQTFAAIQRIVEKKFGGGMEKLSTTMSGRLSNLVDTINIKAGQFAEESGILDFGKDFVAEITTMLEDVDFTQFTETIKGILPDAKELATTIKNIASNVLEWIQNHPDLVDLAAKLVALNLALTVTKFLFGDIGKLGLGLAQVTFPAIAKAAAAMASTIAGTEVVGKMNTAWTTASNAGKLAFLGKAGMFAAVAVGGFQLGQELAKVTIEPLIQAIADAEEKARRAASEANIASAKTLADVALAKKQAGKTNEAMQRSLEFLIVHGTEEQRAQARASLQKLATGGIVKYAANGLFTPRGTDTVPAMLTPGEAVMSKKAVEKFAKGESGNVIVNIDLSGSVLTNNLIQEMTKRIERTINRRTELNMLGLS